MFWRLTLREISVILSGVAETRKREANERAWLAWHIGALGRIKRYPKLRDILPGGVPSPVRQTVDEQVAIARQWTAALSRKR